MDEQLIHIIGEIEHFNGLLELAKANGGVELGVAIKQGQVELDKAEEALKEFEKQHLPIIDELING
jgi:hypothetical protein